MLGIATCGYLVYSIFFGGFFNLTESGREVLIYTGPYLLVGGAIYFLYGRRHSKLRLAQNPLVGDTEFLSKEHEKRTD
jgi:drug/metabolite transporter (DMT)-like permease